MFLPAGSFQRPGDADILGDAALEELDVLEDDGELVHQRRGIVAADVVAADADLAGIGVVADLYGLTNAS